uniref:uncharacterized protein LOC122591896 n=1 Tax=Erigeron canadensis TaxID=72917 RepID=UPI001CB94AC5|nr:uncharacterized protein LOC122591896 [Erigeron canadensis]
MSSTSSESRAVVVESASSSETNVHFLQNAVQWMDDTANSNDVRHRKYVNQEREVCHQILLNDWFVDEPKYDDAYFRKKFRMEKTMFLKIVDDIQANFPYFQEGFDACRNKLQDNPKSVLGGTLTHYGQSARRVR